MDKSLEELAKELLQKLADDINNGILNMKAELVKLIWIDEHEDIEEVLIKLELIMKKTVIVIKKQLKDDIDGAANQIDSFMDELRGDIYQIE